ncbi:DUF362 domain-containing protein [Roseisolibacter sp. H3M3-2]|uniref:DUF362 domain-containing protein n=1 Tax=Roseisolibacter sp. H3M3-2 TaxID=3031323 RepID=UPI0023DBD3AF|nr:DUF362 domain-containing protein [Roseisolibacter sp. H3M3-2]MDF1501891.1 DUF362 domain-containing protein [Roseisolibacter sp. H3M3-2]
MSFTRRQFVGAVAGGVVAGAVLAPLASRAGRREREQRWGREAYVRPERSRVAVVRADDYGDRLDAALREGLALFPLDVRGRRIVLKPNLVEFDPAGVINTHPALVAAAARVFRSMGAREVVVAEGPGHRRDNEYLLDASGLGAALDDAGVRYVDLNVDAVRRVAPRSRFTGLPELWLPETVAGADLLVSMPKLKTHHWAGATLSMKNLFGIMPGSYYGWPKNLLHVKGIPNSIVDINASLPVRRFNIVDGIVGMEGNGPIQGTARRSGLLAFGEDPVAVDATCARLMTLEPSRIGYLADAGAFLGNVEAERIEQVGETLERFRQDFAVLDQFRDLKPRRHDLAR